MSTTPIQLGSRGHSLAAHVEDVLRARIREGIFQPGSLLPSRRALCADLGIAPTTLEKAVKALLEDGTLRAEPRRGTFVADTLPPAEERVAMANSAHRRFKESRTPRIGVISIDNDLISLDPVQAFFDYMVLHSVEDRVSSLGGELVYRSPQPRQFDPAYLMDGAVDEFVKNGADAIVFIAVHLRVAAVEREMIEAARLGVPTVVVSSSSREWNTTHVWTDNRMAGRCVAEHLLENGHNRIAFLAPYNAFWQDDRLLGARDAMRQAGLDDNNLVVIKPEEFIVDDLPEHQPAVEAGIDLAKVIGRDFSAAIAVNDWVALGVTRCLTQCGITPGEDVAIVSFDDQSIARRNGISSFRFPLETLGAEAGTLAMRAANGEKLQHRLRIVGRVVARQSTRRFDPSANLAPA